MPSRCTGPAAAPVPSSPLTRIESRSNGAGQIINSPKPSSRMAAPECSTSGSKSKMRVIALNASATAENETTNPKAIIAGLILPL
jgi:hypothetical protein